MSEAQRARPSSRGALLLTHTNYGEEDGIGYVPDVRVQHY
jgi:hypothetical protein